MGGSRRCGSLRIERHDAFGFSKRLCRTLQLTLFAAPLWAHVRCRVNSGVPAADCHNNWRAISTRSATAPDCYQQMANVALGIASHFAGQNCHNMFRAALVLCREQH